MSEVWIVQPYVPGYRVPFFEGLAARLAQRGITLRVVAGRPDRRQGARGDSVSPSWLTRADERLIRIGGRSITLTNTRRHWGSAAAVIVPHMGSSVDALSALAWKSQLRVGVWGHIAAFTAEPHPLDQAVENWQLRRADHVFAYTTRGAEHARARGVPDDRISVVMNSVDTRSLVARAAMIGAEDPALFRQQHNIPEGRLFAYIGGLDASKRVDFLAETLDELHRRGSDVHLVVGGAGDESGLLQRAVRRRQVTMLGYVDELMKARLLNASIAVVNPGRVGLIAVEALAMKIPVMTTAWKYHAPEIEYLEAGSSLHASTDTVADFARMVDEFYPAGNRQLSVAEVPTIELMINNFSLGVCALIGTDS